METSEMDIIKRIKEILEMNKISPSKLADSLKMSRSRMSHILTGRNNPTLEVVMGILSLYPSINPDWFMFGREPVFRIDIKDYASDLFSFPNSNKKAENKDNKEIILPEPQKDIKTDLDKSDYTRLNSQLVKEKDTGEIKKIIVFMNNSNYEEFIPSKD